MQQDNVSNVIRKYFAAFLAQDRKTLEEGLSDDFTFTSPRDEHISKAAFFERCLPGSDQFLTFQIQKLFVQGNVLGMYLFGYGNFISTVGNVGFALSKHFSILAGYQLGSHLVVKQTQDRIGLRLVQKGAAVGLETSF